MNDTSNATVNIDAYYNSINENSYNYREMYNTYNVEFYLSHNKKYDRALSLALKEVSNRPTPETYSLLAHTYYKMGENKLALELVENHIANKTFEPAILYKAAEIYKANGQLDKVKHIKKELISAVYELEPKSKYEIERL